MKTYTITYTNKGVIKQADRKANSAKEAILKLAAQYGWKMLEASAKEEPNLVGKESCEMLSRELHIGSLFANEN